MKILIADDHALYRDGLRLNLSNLLPDADILDAASFSQAAEALKNNPDTTLVLADLGMPDTGWEDGIQKLQAAMPNIRIGVISASEDVHTIKKILGLGICCYLPKNIDTKVLNSALNLVLNGGTYYPPALLAASSENMNLANGKKLTNRQFEVLKYLAQGLSNKQIAYQMNVSEATVKLHINALLRALGATNRTQTVIKAQKSGLI